MERRDHLQKEGGGAAGSPGKYSLIVGGIKTALAQDRLSRLGGTTRHLRDHPENAPEVVTELNAALGRCALSFRWFPGTGSESAKLLIRNESIGLLIDTTPGSLPVGMMITHGDPAPVQSCSFPPESALSLLSLQVRNHSASNTTLSAAKTRLQLVPQG
jgi:hypothetical protein